MVAADKPKGEGLGWVGTHGYCAQTTPPPHPLDAATAFRICVCGSQQRSGGVSRVAGFRGLPWDPGRRALRAEQRSKKRGDGPPPLI